MNIWRMRHLLRFHMPSPRRRCWQSKSAGHGCRLFLALSLSNMTAALTPAAVFLGTTRIAPTARIAAKIDGLLIAGAEKNHGKCSTTCHLYLVLLPCRPIPPKQKKCDIEPLNMHPPLVKSRTYSTHTSIAVCWERKSLSTGSLLRMNTSLTPAMSHLAFPWMDFVHSAGGRLLPGPFSSSTTIFHPKHSSTRTINLTLVQYRVQISPRTLIPSRGLPLRNLCVFSMVCEHLMHSPTSSSCCAPICSSSSATSPLYPW